MRRLVCALGLSALLAAPTCACADPLTPFAERIAKRLDAPPPPIIDIAPASTAPGANVKIVGTPSGLEERYLIYRGAEPYFALDAPYGSMDGASSTFLDAASGVGDSTRNWFYAVRAVNGTDTSDASNRVGEIDLPLYAGPVGAANANWITMPIEPTGALALARARDFLFRVPGCLAVDAWDPEQHRIVALCERPPRGGPSSVRELAPDADQRTIGRPWRAYRLRGDSLGSGASTNLALVGQLSEVASPLRLAAWMTDSLGDTLPADNWLALPFAWAHEHPAATLDAWLAGMHADGVGLIGAILAWDASSASIVAAPMSTVPRQGRPYALRSNDRRAPDADWIVPTRVEPTHSAAARPPIARIAIAPNPCLGEARIRVTTLDGPTRVRITDELGREVACMIARPDARGSATITWRADVAPGRYTVSVGNGHATVIVAR